MPLFGIDVQNIETRALLMLKLQLALHCYRSIWVHQEGILSLRGWVSHMKNISKVVVKEKIGGESKQLMPEHRKKFQVARQRIREAKLQEEERLKRLEGITYQAGGFNEELLSRCGRKRVAAEARVGASKKTK